MSENARFFGTAVLVLILYGLLQGLLNLLPPGWIESLPGRGASLHFLLLILAGFLLGFSSQAGWYLLVPGAFGVGFLSFFLHLSGPAIVEAAVEGGRLVLLAVPLALFAVLCFVGTLIGVWARGRVREERLWH